MRRFVVAAGACALATATALAAPAGGVRAAPVNVNAGFTVPVHAELDTSWSCSNNPGPTIEIGGTLAYGGATVTFYFTNNAKWTHNYESSADVDFGVTPTGGTLTLPKQPAKELNGYTGVGGNPYISFQFVDDSNNPLGSPILLGRCVQGTSFKHISSTFDIPAGAQLTVSSLSCTNDKSMLDFGGYVSHVGFAGLLYLDNNINRVVHRATSTANFGVTLDTAISVPKSGSAGGAGGNPWVFMQITGSSTWGPTLLGRCRSLD